MIATYDVGNTKRRGRHTKTLPENISASALRTEIGQLTVKYELLEFGEHSLQAMGYYAQ